jgi:hypothetical protein
LRGVILGEQVPIARHILVVLLQGSAEEMAALRVRDEVEIVDRSWIERGAQ